MMSRRTPPPTLCALVILAAACAALVLPSTTGGHGAPGDVLLALLAGAILVEALPLHFPNRADVTLSVLPAALLAYYAGPYSAALAAALAIVAAHWWRRRPVPAVTIAVAIVSIWIAALLAHAAVAVAPRLPDKAPIGLLEIGVFCITFAAVFPALSGISGDDHPRPEPISSLLMLPVALTLVNLAAWRGLDLLPLFLLGAGIFLLLVRGNVNMLTLHRRMTRLAHSAEEMTTALTVEHDALAAIVTYSAEGIFTVDKGLRIRHFNPALAALTGVNADSAVGHAADEVLGSCHAASELGQVLKRALREGRAVRVDSALEANGQRREITTRYTAIPAPNGDLALGVGVVRDVTEEREDARIRDDYFSLITHDLRNPLTATIGNTHLLDQELARTLDDMTTARRLVERIEKANQQLLRLVNNLLELQRIESGRELLRPQSVLLRPLVEEVAAEFHAAAHERGQTLRVDGPDLRAWGDPTWCREIVVNLVSNAVKYTPRGGSVDLSLEARGGQVAICVRDTGYGLVPDEQEKLFTKFFRGKRPEIRAARGSGLGLALTKRMAERMNGDIVVSSTVGVGSTFTALLPLGDLPPFLDAHAPLPDRNAEATETAEAPAGIRMA